MVGRCVVGLALLGLFGAGCKKAAPAPDPFAYIKESQKELPEIIGVALKEGTDFELFSLGSLGKEESKKQRKMGYEPVLGSTKIKSPELREELTTAFLDAAYINTASFTACDPNFRHAIRVKYQGSNFDLLICFECSKGAARHKDEYLHSFQINGKPEPLFDKVLTEAGVKLAEKPK